MPETRVHFLWSYVFSGAIFLNTGITILGLCLIDKDFHPKLVPVPPALKVVGYIGLFITLLAPVFAIAACVAANFDAKKVNSERKRKTIWFCAILAATLALLEFLYSGHPIWYMAFAGRAG